MCRRSLKHNCVLTFWVISICTGTHRLALAFFPGRCQQLTNTRSQDNRELTYFCSVWMPCHQEQRELQGDAKAMEKSAFTRAQDRTCQTRSKATPPSWKALSSWKVSRFHPACEADAGVAVGSAGLPVLMAATSPQAVTPG